MPNRNLARKPLVEAIFEVRWALGTSGQGMQSDPNYRLLVGRFHDRIQPEYPFYEQLQTAAVPDELVAYAVQHRFRKAHEGWPLTQIGPGILTFNETAGYDWAPFCDQASNVLEKFLDAYPNRAQLRINSLVLRYIDAVEFDYETDDLFEFLRRLKINISLPQALFEEQGVIPKPHPFVWQTSFVCTRPEGLLTLKIGAGKKEERNAVIWETIIESREEEVPTLPEDFNSWADAAHRVTTDWFFKMIEGDLERRFANV